MLLEAIKKSVKNMGVGKVKTKTIILADLEKTDLREQMKKIFEEEEEVKYAYKLLKSAEMFDGNGTIIKLREKQLISELYDLIQATAGAIWILENGVSMNNEHIEKMEEYTKTGRINNKAREE
jgi:hypothetical protein